MNTRIKELAEQAGYVPLNPRAFADDLPDILLQKFAGLIIQECIDVIIQQRDSANLNYKPSERYADALRQHFGVKS